MDNKFTTPFKADRALEAHIAGKLGIDVADNDRGVRDIVNQIVRIRSEYGRKAEQLETAAERMAEDLKRTAREAGKAKQNSSYSINSLGVLQGQGPNLDRLCGELQILSDHLDLIEGPWDSSNVGVTPVFALGDEVVSVDAPDSGTCEVVAVNEDGTYDVEPADGSEVVPSVSAAELKLAPPRRLR